MLLECSVVILPKVRLIPVPILNEEFQITIKKLIALSWETRESSRAAYCQAEDLLLSELGLKNWQPTDENIALG